MHSPGQVEEGLVCSDCIHGPLSDHLRFKRRKELRKPTREKKVVFTLNDDPSNETKNAFPSYIHYSTNNLNVWCQQSLL